MKIIPNKKIWFTISGILVGLSVVSFLVWGIKLGIDFTGGSLMELQFAEHKPASSEELQNVFKEVQISINASVSSSETTEGTNENNESTVLSETKEITVPEKKVAFGDPVIIPSQATTGVRTKVLDEYAHKKILEALAEKYPGVTETKFTTIGPTVGETLKQRAFVALGIAIIGMIIFITFAFRKVPKKISPWKFGVTAIIALFHDILIPVGIFVLLGQLFNMEVETYFITALLTVLGFSVNDTIVVFDRIRENMMYQKRDETFADVAEKSVQQTITRSINTSLTTFITLLFLFIFGSESIRLFVLTLMIGVLVGTYSSIFIASPLLVAWKEKGVK